MAWLSSYAKKLDIKIQDEKKNESFGSKMIQTTELLAKIWTQLFQL